MYLLQNLKKMSNIAIKVENLSKLYQIGRAQQQHDTLRDLLMDVIRSPFRKDGTQESKRVFDLVMRFGTSLSPKRTRPSTA